MFLEPKHNAIHSRMTREIEYKFLPQDPFFRPKGQTDFIEQGFFFLDGTSEGRLIGDVFALYATRGGPEVFRFQLPASDANALRTDLGPTEAFGQNWYARPRIVSTESGQHALMTLKGPGTHNDIERPEYEYPIDLADSRRLLNLTGSARIDKTRTHMIDDGWHWEVDSMKGRLEKLGIVFCEIELPSIETVYSKPAWVGENVTGRKEFKNVALAKGKPLPNSYLRWLQGKASHPFKGGV